MIVSSRAALLRVAPPQIRGRNGEGEELRYLAKFRHCGNSDGVRRTDPGDVVARNPEPSVSPFAAARDRQAATTRQTGWKRPRQRTLIPFRVSTRISGLRGKGGSASENSCATASPMSIASPTSGSNADLLADQAGSGLFGLRRAVEQLEPLGEYPGDRIEGDDAPLLEMPLRNRRAAEWSVSPSGDQFDRGLEPVQRYQIETPGQRSALGFGRADPLTIRLGPDPGQLHAPRELGGAAHWRTAPWPGPAARPGPADRRTRCRRPATRPCPARDNAAACPRTYSAIAASCAGSGTVGAEEVARQCRTQHGIIRRKPFLVCRKAPIEGFRHPFHLASDAEIAGSHLAQRAVEIGEHRRDKPSAVARRSRLLVLEPVQVKEGVQTDQFKPAVDRVGDAAIQEETGLARLLDDPPIGEFGGGSLRIGFEQREHWQ